MANLNLKVITKPRKEKLDLLIKLDKCLTECDWDYQRACEYRDIKNAKRCTKIRNLIEKKMDQLWNQIYKSCKVEHRWDLPSEIIDYYDEGRYNNRYDRFNDYESDLIRLGVLKRK